jgi:hypothetical protein
VVALVLVVGLVAGCGGTSGGTGGDAGQQGGGGGSQGGGGGGQDEELAWVPFGPSDPTFPTPAWPLYRELADGNCSTLQANLTNGNGTGEFGTAMLALCLAAVEGHQDQWAVAKAAAGADASKLGNDCVAAVVKDLLDRALAWHDRHPGATPTVRFHRLSGQTECGRQDSQTTEETTPGSESTADTGSSSSDTTADTTTGST